ENLPGSSDRRGNRRLDACLSCNLSCRHALYTSYIRAMEATAILEKARIEEWTDEQVIKRVLAGEAGLYEIIMRRYNQRLYRVVLAILRDETEAEDVMQEAYVRAYRHLAQFEGRSQFSTWLIRIAVHEALARRRRNSRLEQFAEGDEENVAMNL